MPALEVICSTIEDVQAAVAGGADSIELCVELSVGGLTPPLTLVQQARDRAQCCINVLVRPHARSFVYDTQDRDHIFSVIAALQPFRVEGVVFGALTSDASLDQMLMRDVASACGPMTLTMHRALDDMPNPDRALALLPDIAQRVLTSGGTPAIAHGLIQLTDWVQRYGSIYRFAAGGGVTEANLQQVARTGVPEVHVGRAAQVNGRVDAQRVRHLRRLLATFEADTTL